MPMILAEMASLRSDDRHLMEAQPFDWYLGYARLVPLLRRRLPPAGSVKILDVGCGTSEVAACLHADGWTAVTGVDVSSSAIQYARNAWWHENRPELQFLHMDACDLTFSDASFHAVLDKATLDCLACDSQPFLRVTALLAEIYRVLQPGGVYFLVSHAGPAARLPYLACDHDRPWRIEHASIPKYQVTAGEDATTDGGGGFFHVYICTKPGFRSHPRE